MDGDDQLSGRGRAIAIGERIGKGVLQRLPVIERIDGRIGVVQRVGVSAIVAQAQRAMGAAENSWRDRCGIDIGADGVVAQD